MIGYPWVRADLPLNGDGEHPKDRNGGYYQEHPFQPREPLHIANLTVCVWVRGKGGREGGRETVGGRERYHHSGGWNQCLLGSHTKSDSAAARSTTYLSKRGFLREFLSLLLLTEQGVVIRR